MNETAINERFDRIDDSIERVSERLDHISQRVDHVTLGLERVTLGLERVTQRLDQVTQGLERVTQGLDHLTKYVLEFREETITRLQVIESRLDFLSLTVASFESRFPAMTKSVLENGSFLTQLVREQSRQKDSTLDLAGRLAAMEVNLSKLMNPAA